MPERFEVSRGRNPLLDIAVSVCAASRMARRCRPMKKAAMDKVINKYAACMPSVLMALTPAICTSLFGATVMANEAIGMPSCCNSTCLSMDEICAKGSDDVGVLTVSPDHVACSDVIKSTKVRDVTLGVNEASTIRTMASLSLYEMNTGSVFES